jgi:hypothetical protein
MGSIVGELNEIIIKNFTSFNAYTVTMTIITLLILFQSNAGLYALQSIGSFIERVFKNKIYIATNLIHLLLYSGALYTLKKGSYLNDTVSTHTEMVLLGLIIITLFSLVAKTTMKVFNFSRIIRNILFLPESSTYFNGSQTPDEKKAIQELMSQHYKNGAELIIVHKENQIPLSVYAKMTCNLLGIMIDMYFISVITSFNATTIILAAVSLFTLITYQVNAVTKDKPIKEKIIMVTMIISPLFN